MTRPHNLRLTVSRPEKRGLTAALSSFISMHDGNTLAADGDVSDGTTSFMSPEIEGEGFGLARTVRPHLEDRVIVDGNRTVLFE